MPEELNKKILPVRTGQGSTKLTIEQFRERWNQRFYDPAFEAVPDEIDSIV